MWYCTACCMQDWKESCLCPAPAAADLSKEISASWISISNQTPFLIIFFLQHPPPRSTFNFLFSTSFCFHLYSTPPPPPPPCLRSLPSVLLQVLFPASGSSQSRDQVRSPAASLLPHRAVWLWASASAASSSPQTLLQGTTGLTGGWRAVVEGF